MSLAEEHARRQAYLKAWFAAAGNDAARFTWLTIEEIAIARASEARTAASLQAAATDKDNRRRFLPTAKPARRRRR